MAQRFSRILLVTVVFFLFICPGKINFAADPVFDPAQPTAGSALTIIYTGFLQDEPEVVLHWGVDGWQEVTDSAMEKQPDGSWRVTVDIPQAATSSFDCVFHNNAGNWDNNGGSDYHLDVQPWVADLINPAVSLTAPSDGALLQGTVSLVAEASDNVGVTRVAFFVNDTQVGEDSSVPYSHDLDTTALANGAVVLKAVAWDAAGNSAYATVNATVNNDSTPPQVSFTIDQNADNVVGVLQTTITASDNQGIARVELLVDGTLQGSDSTTPYGISLDSTALANGSHILRVQAIDTAGNTAGADLEIVVANNPSEPLRRIYYQGSLSGRSMFIQYRSTGDSFNAFPGDRMAAGQSGWYTWEKTLPAGGLEVRFQASGGRWDNNQGANYTVFSNQAWIRNGQVYYSDPDSDQPPVVDSLTVPQAPATGTVTLSATASDDHGVQKVAFYLGATLLQEDNMAPYSVQLDTSAYTNGSYSVRAVAFDSSGQNDERSAVLVISHPQPDKTLVFYKPVFSNPYIHYNAGSGWTTAPGVSMSVVSNGWFKAEVACEGTLEFVFNNGGDIWDNNGGQNYSSALKELWVKDGSIYPGNPDGPVTSVNVTVHYKTGWSSANIHYNDGQAWTTVPGVSMENYRSGWFRKTMQRKGAELRFVFNDGGGTWDNNGGGDYVTSLTNVWVDGGQILAEDPEGPQPPTVSASPAGGYFTGETVEITLKVSGENITLARYTLDGSDPAQGGTPYNDGDRITIGADMQTNQSKTVRLFSQNNIGGRSKEYTFTKVAEIPQPSFSWDNATVYFVLTDRFLDGNPANNNSYGRVSGTGPGDWHGGDLAGLTQKLNENYFTDLGVNVIWISCPFEQIHGWVVGGGGAFKHWGYHGYFAHDFTLVDQNMGSDQDLRTFIDTAHAQGIRIVFDVVMNHAGYNTIIDMNEFGFGELYSGWENAGLNNYHDFINYDSQNWVAWWGPDWIRAGLPGYTAPGNDDLTRSLEYLPDFRTESTAHVGLPAFYQNKPDTHAVYLPNTTVRGYLIKWLTDWVREYGVDGFRCDTAKHVELEAWAELKTAAVQALRDWKAANPDKKLDDLDFWMTGEVWGHGPNRSDYHSNGFDSIINFAFQGAASGALGNPANIESTYSQYARDINSDPGFNALSYISSHDTALFFSSSAGGNTSNQKRAGELLLLCPGAVQIYYGDECARANSGGNVGSDEDQRTRSPMPWPGDTDVLAHWQKIGRFRSRHIAIGAGSHNQINASPYTFNRIKDNDKVVCVLGASGNVNVNVSSTFSEGTQVRDYYSGATATVSGGQVSFTADGSGVLLIEKAE